MIRNGLATDAAHAMMVVTPGNGTAFQYRNITGDISNDSHTPGPLAPEWVKLTRVGNEAVGYYSSDGINWIEEGSTTLPSSSTMYIGLVVCSGNYVETNTSTFDHVSVATVATTAPSNVTATEVSVSQVHLTWAAPPGWAGSYAILRSTSPGMQPYTRLNATPVSGTTFDDTSVNLSAPGSTYYYQVVATDLTQIAFGPRSSIATVQTSGPTKWIEQGPRPLNWPTGQNRPDTGSVQSIAVNPNNPSQVYVGTVNGGVWRSDNVDPANPALTSWTSLSDQEASLAIGDIAFSPLDPSGMTLFAGTGSFSSLAGLGGPTVGVLRTADGGATWSNSPLNPGGPEYHVASVLPTAIDMDPGPGIQEVVLVGTVAGGGLYRSNDNGQTYTYISGLNGLPTGEVSRLIADPNNSHRFYAGVAHQGVFRGEFDPTTGAINWSPINTNITGIAAATSIQLAAYAGPSTVLYALVRESHEVYRSIDDGASWTPLATAPTDFTQGNDAIVADPTDSQVVYIATYGGNNNVYRYDPSGSGQWIQIVGGGALSGSSPHVDYRDLAFIGNNVLVASSDGGIFCITNPMDAAHNAWSSLNGSGGTGIGSVEMHNVAWDSVFHVAVGGSQDNGTEVQTAPGSKMWSEFFGGDGGDVAVDSETLALAGDRSATLVHRV